MTADTTFTVTAHDANGNSASTDIHLKLNHAPSVTTNKVKVIVPTGETIPSTTIDLSHYFSDSDGDSLTYDIYPYSEDSDFTVTADGHTITYSGLMSSNSYEGADIYADDGKGGETYLSLEIDPNPVNVENKIQNAYLFKNFSGNIAYVNLRNNFSDSDERELSFEKDPSSVIPDGYNVMVTGDYLYVTKSDIATDENTPSTFDVKIKATEIDTYETGDPLNTGYATYRFNEFSAPTTVEVDNSNLSTGISFDLNSDLLDVNESIATGLEASLLDETSSWLTLSGDTGDTTISLASGTALSGATATVSLTVSNNLSQTATKLVTFKSTDFGSAQLRDRTLNRYQEVNLGDLNRRYGITNPMNYHAKSLFDGLDGSFENGSEFSLVSFSSGSNLMGVLGLDAKTGNGRIDTFNISATDSDELYFLNPFSVGENFSTSNIVSSDPLFQPSMTLTGNYITITPNYVGTEPYGMTDFTVYATNADGTIASKIKVRYSFGME
jgi:hypothetical protein